KLEVAQRIHDLVTRAYGWPPERLLFDVLTFTLATGDAEFLESGIQTIEGIRLIKQALPGVLTSLGVSNVSFGLSKEARAALNSVFLYHCVRAGLDMAIVNAADIIPYAEIGDDDRRLAEELILPFVLQSAEVMKKAVARLETYLEKSANVSKGRVVLATVYGDVHDIGKNLVKTILSNNGYTVHDLGKQVPVTTIIEKAKEV